MHANILIKPVKTQAKFDELSPWRAQNPNPSGNDLFDLIEDESTGKLPSHHGESIHEYIYNSQPQLTLDKSARLEANQRTDHSDPSTD